MKTYDLALQGTSSALITEAATNFVRGLVKGHKGIFPPSPAEFCKEVRRIADLRPSLKEKKKYYRVEMPGSDILVSNVTKDRAKQMVDNGAAPRGSIWIPGPLPGSFGDNPAFGDLYGPDPNWSFDKTPINDRKEPEAVAQSEEERIRMKFKVALWSKAGATGQLDALAKAQETGRMEEFIALAQKWGVEVPEGVWKQKDHVWTKPANGRLMPFQKAFLDAKRRYAHRPLLAESLTLQQFKSQSWPVGAQWVPLLNGNVYGPAKDT